MGLTIILAPLTTVAQTGRLQHTPVATATAGKPLALEASVQGAATLPVSGRIYYRNAGENAFDYAEFRVQQETLKGEIPAGNVVEGELQYYLEAILADAAVLTYPEGAPLSAEPLSVNVKSAGATAVSAGEGIVILSPEPGARLTDGSILIAVSFLQNLKTIKPEQLKVTLDGKDLTRKAVISEQMLSVTVEGVEPGSHNLAISYGGEPLASWGCIMFAPEVARRLPGMYHGTVEAGYNHEEVSSRVRNITYLDGRVGTTLGKLDLNAQAYITSLERGYLQPQNRFSLGARYGKQVVRVGDVQPRFSEFTLWGNRTRGAELALRSPFLNLDFAWGYLRRSAEGSWDTTYVTDPTGVDTLTNQFGQDSIRVHLNPGTYSRRLLAIRPGFPISPHSTFSINILKAKDDISSIDYGQSPADNLVIGADLQAESASRRFQFNSEVAISAYNSDISSGPSSDAKDAESIIVINQFFQPLPADSSFLQSGLSTADLAKKVFKELGESALAHRTTFTMNYFRNEVRIAYRSVGRSFRSLGSPTVETDLQGFSLQDRLRLMNNRIYLTLGYEGYSDNVNKRAETTTDRTILRGGISYYTPPQYPDFSFGYRLYDRQNNGALATYISPSQDTTNVDTRVDASQNTINFSLDHGFRFYDFDHQATLTFSSSASEDNIQADAESNIRTLALSLISRRAEWLETRVSFTNNSQSSLQGDYTVDYNDISLGGRYLVLPKKLWVSGGFNITLADGANSRLDTYDPAADTTSARNDSTLRRKFTLDFSRTRFSIGADYTPWDKHEFRLDAYIAGQSDDSFTEYYSGRRETLSNSSGYVKQNDFVTRLTYTYTF
jgi:hypothetical protein